MTYSINALQNMLNMMEHYNEKADEYQRLIADAWFQRDHLSHRKFMAEFRDYSQRRDDIARKIGNMIYALSEDFDLAMTPRIKAGQDE